MREAHEPGIHTPQRFGLWIPGSRAKSPRPGMTYQKSCRKPEMHHVAVGDHVLFAFEPHLAGVAGAGLATGRDVVVVADGLGADEALLEIGVDHAGRLRGLGA